MDNATRSRARFGIDTDSNSNCYMACRVSGRVTNLVRQLEERGVRGCIVRTEIRSRSMDEKMQELNPGGYRLMKTADPKQPLVRDRQYRKIKVYPTATA
jgi:hypothetical protein